MAPKNKDGITVASDNQIRVDVTPFERAQNRNIRISISHQEFVCIPGVYGT